MIIIILSISGVGKIYPTKGYSVVAGPFIPEGHWNVFKELSKSSCHWIPFLGITVTRMTENLHRHGKIYIHFYFTCLFCSFTKNSSTTGSAAQHIALSLHYSERWVRAPQSRTPPMFAWVSVGHYGFLPHSKSGSYKVLCTVTSLENFFNSPEGLLARHLANHSN